MEPLLSHISSSRVLPYGLEATHRTESMDGNEPKRGRPGHTPEPIRDGQSDNRILLSALGCLSFLCESKVFMWESMRSTRR